MGHSSGTIPTHSRIRTAAVRLTAIIVLAAVAGAVYWLAIRPRQLRWGATDEEVARPMPEDAIVQRPSFDATRAITIYGRPEQIWPWLVQMGFGRAGFYGYDLIENAGSGTAIRSAQRILPQFQNPRPGDDLPLSVAATLKFGTVDPNRCLVWRAPDVPPSGVFIWELVPIDSSQTRLISRIRWRYLQDPEQKALGLFTEFGDHVAVRAILRGVRDRVEGRPPESLFAEACEIASWLLGLLEIAMGALFILLWRRWPRAWLLAAGACFLLQLVLYGPLPNWVSSALPWLYLVFMIWAWKREKAGTRIVPHAGENQPANLAGVS